MSTNPTAVLPRRTRVAVQFCLNNHPRNGDLICTRLNNHKGHCCDEIAGESWDDRGRPANCVQKHDHSKEKGLVAA